VQSSACTSQNRRAEQSRAVVRTQDWMDEWMDEGLFHFIYRPISGRTYAWIVACCMHNFMCAHFLVSFPYSGCMNININSMQESVWTFIQAEKRTQKQTQQWLCDRLTLTISLSSHSLLTLTLSLSLSLTHSLTLWLTDSHTHTLKYTHTHSLHTHPLTYFNQYTYTYILCTLS